MQQSLVLLLLMGQSSFFLCQVHQYHFISEPKTWEDALNYCKEKYTNLATVPNLRFMRRLLEAAGDAGDAWIGLSMNTTKKGSWHWSLTGVEFKNQMRWDDGEPHNVTGDGRLENCVRMNWNGKWADVPCSARSKSICYDGTNASQKTFHPIEDKKTWRQAQSHCRKKHRDLVSGLDQLDEDNLVSALRQLNKDNLVSALSQLDEDNLSSVPGDGVWIGLFRDKWEWSDNSDFNYRRWESDTEPEEEVDPVETSIIKCAAVNLSSGKWKPQSCDTEKPFFCYTDRTTLIKENLTWYEAIDRCREIKKELVSVTDPEKQVWVRHKAKNATRRYIWLGLRYSCPLVMWFWISDRALCYNNWAKNPGNTTCDTAVAMDKNRRFKWVKKSDMERFNAICSED